MTFLSAGFWGQVLRVARHELTRKLVTRRTLPLLALAFVPVVAVLGHAWESKGCNVEEDTVALAVVVQVVYVRLGVFCGALVVFMGLVRGDVADRTLHYLLLAPLRREAVLLGKFTAGVALAVPLFSAAVASSALLLYGHLPAGREFLASGPGLAHLGAYLLATALACIGYGAVFLALSLSFRNPVVPAVVMLVWEGINAALPVWLKHLSVVFYVKQIFPVELPVEGISGLFTVVAEPMPGALAVAGVLAFAGAVVALACWRARALEVSYSGE